MIVLDYCKGLSEEYGGEIPQKNQYRTQSPNPHHTGLGEDLGGFGGLGQWEA